MAELHRLEREGPSTKAHIQHFTTASPTLAGSLCGVAMQYIFDQEKPTLALAALGGTIKVSSRGTDYLIAKGLDLAVALREAAGAVGGNGGGHNIAAGATLPEGSEGKFLSLVDEIVGKQLGGKDRPR
jgi:single-stranded DNA-specific DHH superfamily exonuclease